MIDIPEITFKKTVAAKTNIFIYIFVKYIYLKYRFLWFVLADRVSSLNWVPGRKWQRPPPAIRIFKM